MKLQTNLFGEIDTEQVKKIYFQDGIIGFPDMKEFALITDEEKKDNNHIFWLQSLDDGGFAMPLIDPFAVFDDYNPVVEDEWFQGLGEHEEEDLILLLTLAVPKDVKQMSVNQKAPVIINSNTCRACQIIVESEQYQVHCPVYDILKSKNGKAGD